jgi:spore coat protein U-like protein
MRNAHRVPIVLAGVVIAATIAHAAHAQSTAAARGFNVLVTITAACQLASVSIVKFSTQPGVPGAYLATGAIVVECTKGLPYTLGLDGGQSGNVNARAMRGPSGVLIPYTLSLGAGGRNWGDSAGDWVTGAGDGFGSANAITYIVYATAAVSGKEPAGAYADTVVATITY